MEAWSFSRGKGKYPAYEYLEPRTLGKLALGAWQDANPTSDNEVWSVLRTKSIAIDTQVGWYAHRCVTFLHGVELTCVVTLETIIALRLQFFRSEVAEDLH